MGKSCPFCGPHSEYIAANVSHLMDPVVVIACSNPKCPNYQNWLERIDPDHAAHQAQWEADLAALQGDASFTTLTETHVTTREQLERVSKVRNKPQSDSSQT